MKFDKYTVAVFVCSNFVSGYVWVLLDQKFPVTNAGEYVMHAYGSLVVFVALYFLYQKFLETVITPKKVNT